MPLTLQTGAGENRTQVKVLVKVSGCILGNQVKSEEE
jgi:hypothetical protein